LAGGQQGVMIIDWLGRGTGRDLIVFCNGWGMDRWPLSDLATDAFAVVVLSDYHRLDGLDGLETVRAELPCYQRRYLICWSMGVWAGQRLFAQDRGLFARWIAINGTLRPVDDRFGIPVDIFSATLEEFSSSILERFYRRMCKEPASFPFLTSIGRGAVWHINAGNWPHCNSWYRTRPLQSPSMTT
jgi:pimeloyl-[acyl-carrier protein] methyl ester esterase